MTSSSCASASEQVSMSAVRIGSPGALKSNRPEKLNTCAAFNFLVHQFYGSLLLHETVWLFL